ncbi:MAG: hypothetical protein R3F45_11645 [Gammaproteobacteria bacterium]
MSPTSNTTQSQSATPTRAMETDTKSSLFRGMAVLLARIRMQERHLERLRAELAFVSFSAEQGYASAVACRNDLRSSIAAVEARLDSLRAALEEGDRKAAEVRPRTRELGDPPHG